MPSNGSHFRHSYPTRPSVAPKKGGRRPKEFEDYEHVQLSEEERDKRDKRRQRNKEAAARCRQRRLDLMGQLQEEVDKLKAANEQKEDIIRSLKMQKMELESILRNNGCKVMEDENNMMANMNHQQSYHAPMHVRRHSPPLPPSSNRKRQPPPVALSQPPKTLKMEPTLNQIATQDLDMQRPTSLTLDGSGTPSSCAGGDCWNPAGLPITTPSSGLAPAHCNSDFMLLNQQTGLTPVTHGALIASYPTSSIATPLDHELKNL